MEGSHAASHAPGATGSRVLKMLSLEYPEPKSIQYSDKYEVRD